MILEVKLSNVNINLIEEEILNKQNYDVQDNNESGTDIITQFNKLYDTDVQSTEHPAINSDG
ncbi:4937_t:CDS:2, partial [Entrophospora sp. SA101]